MAMAVVFSLSLYIRWHSVTPSVHVKPIGASEGGSGMGVRGIGDWVSHDYIFWHESSSGVEIWLYTKNQLPMYSGSGTWFVSGQNR